MTARHLERERQRDSARERERKREFSMSLVIFVYTHLSIMETSFASLITVATHILLKSMYVCVCGPIRMERARKCRTADSLARVMTTVASCLSSSRGTGYWVAKTVC